MYNRKNCGVGSGAGSIGKIALGGLLGTTFLCGTAAPVLAAADDHDTLDVSGLQRIDDGSMDDLRGGFNVGGYEISFGITVTTTVNGQQLLQTSFNVNQPGQINDVVTQYIQQQQAAMANGGGTGSSGGSGGGSAGNIQVEVEIDEDGDIDIDVDSDIDFDDDDAPELAQALDDFKDAMRDLEKGGVPPTGQSGSSGSGGSQNTTTLNSTSGNLTSTETSPPPVSDAASTEGSAPAAPAFQQTVMTPLTISEPPAAASGSASSGDTQNGSQASGGQTPAVPNSSSGSSGDPGWTVTELPTGSGWTVSSKDLATTITQVIGDGVSTSIVNRADGIVVEHMTEMNLYMENFQDMQAQAITSQAISSLMQDMATQAAGTN